MDRIIIYIKAVVIFILALRSFEAKSQNYKSYTIKNMYYYDSIVYSRAKIDTIQISGFLLRSLGGNSYFVPTSYLDSNSIEKYFENIIKKNLEGNDVLDSILYHIAFKVEKGSYEVPFPVRPSLEFLNDLAYDVFLKDNFNYNKVYKYKNKLKANKCFSIYYLSGDFARIRLPSSFNITLSPKITTLKQDKFVSYSYYCILINNKNVSFEYLNVDSLFYHRYFKSIFKIKNVK